MAKQKDLTTEIEKFMVDAASRLTMRELDEVAREIPTVRKRLKQPDARDIPNFVAHYAFLADVFEDFVEGRFAELHYPAACEVAYTLHYLAREVDLIPDFVEEVGLVDDATIAIVALQRNRAVLMKHPRANLIDWLDL